MMDFSDVTQMAPNGDVMGAAMISAAGVAILAASVEGFIRSSSGGGGAAGGGVRWRDHRDVHTVVTGC